MSNNLAAARVGKVLTVWLFLALAFSPANGQSGSIALDAGWNLISFDVTFADDSPENVFADLIATGMLEYVTGFDGGTKFFDPDGLPFLNTLAEILPGRGYWVRVTSAIPLAYSGDPLPANFSLSLASGWNLIGYWLDDPVTPEAEFADLITAGVLEFATGFDGGVTFFDPDGEPGLNTLSEIAKNRGYWVKVSTNVTSGEVSEDGGVILTEDGSVVLVVPAGAVNSPITITTNPVTTFPEPERVVGATVFDFGPAGTEFWSLVQLTIQYDVANIPTGVAENDLRLHYMIDGIWSEIEGSTVDVVEQAVTGAINHFSTIGVATQPKRASAIVDCRDNSDNITGTVKIEWDPGSPTDMPDENLVYDDVTATIITGTCPPAMSFWIDVTTGQRCTVSQPKDQPPCTSFVIAYRDPPPIDTLTGNPILPDTPLDNPTTGDKFTLRIHEWMHYFAEKLGFPQDPDEGLNILANFIMEECKKVPVRDWCQFGFSGIDFAADFAAIFAFLQERIDSLPGNTYGDVHIRTPDGLAYDFQGAGEYLFVASGDSSIVVQIRQEPQESSDVASVNTAVAMSLSGDRIAIYLGRAPALYVNGQTTELAAGAILILAGGGRIYRLDVTSRIEYIVWWPNGFVAGAKLYNGYMDVGVSRPEGLQVSLGGLVGNLNGQAQDDIQSRDSVVLGFPLLFDELYRVFGDSWRISAAESLFDYEPGISTDTFQLLDFPPRQVSTDDLDQTVVDAARQSCEDAGIVDPTLLDDCTLDVALTDEQEFVQSTVDSEPPSTPIEVVSLVNGGFDLNADGWFSENLDFQGGWFDTGGNPDGHFALNGTGQLATDPRVCQLIQGLTANKSFTIGGDYASYAPSFGDPAKADAFAVTVNGTVVLELPRPSPVPTDWTAFSTAVITGVEDPTICFEAERDGDDSSFFVDNIALRGLGSP